MTESYKRYDTTKRRVKIKAQTLKNHGIKQCGGIVEGALVEDSIEVGFICSKCGEIRYGI